jgi:pimeloyl-ACP methyl ester carboxylesterase
MTGEGLNDTEKPEMVKFAIDGAEIAVHLEGDREKPPLLLIHGFPGSSQSFRRVIDTFLQDCFLVIPDLPGFGSSEPIERPSRMRLVNECVH